MRRAVGVEAWRAFFRVMNRVAPGAAARVSEALFLTPVSHRVWPREREFLATGRAFDVPFRGAFLRGWSWGDEAGPKVLLSHAWNSNTASFLDLVPRLVRAGHHVVAFDGPAHGESPGTRVPVVLWADAMRAVLDRTGAVEAIVGHSIGGAAIIVGSKLGLPARRIVLLSPLTDIVWFMDDFAERLGISQPVIRRMEDNIWRRFLESAARYGADWHEVFDSRHRMPALVIHDRSDAEIPWGHSQKLLRRWPWARFVSTDGLGHRRICRDGAVLTQVVDFVGDGRADGAARAGRRAEEMEAGRL